MAKEPALTPYLNRIRWRLRLRDGLSTAQNTFWIAALAALLGLVLMRIFPLELKGWVWAPLGLWLIGNIGYALLRPISVMRAARRADFELRLKERLSSSLAFESEKSSQVFHSFAPTLVEHAHQDALEMARKILPSRDFPLTAERRPLAIAGGLLAAALMLNFLPNPMDAVIAERKAVAEAARQQAAEIEKARQEIANASEMTPEEREELLRKLAELAEQLRSNQGDKEKAMADLSRLEEELNARLDPKGNQRQAALDAIAAQLQALAKNENPQIGDLEAAAEAAQQIAEQLEVTERCRTRGTRPAAGANGGSRRPGRRWRPGASAVLIGTSRSIRRLTRSQKFSGKVCPGAPESPIQFGEPESVQPGAVAAAKQPAEHERRGTV